VSAGANRRQLGSRPFNLKRVIFDVKATVAPDAEATFEAIKKRRGLKITNGQANGQNLWLWFEYVVEGGHPWDVRRALQRCLTDPNATLVGEPCIQAMSEAFIIGSGEGRHFRPVQLRGTRPRHSCRDV
jgi:hypothetical protein